MSANETILYNKRIVVGVTGSIAAYKSATLVRLLIKSGAEVKVVMTPDALEFITPLTLATLSKNPVHSDFTEDRNAGTWVNHVDLGLWADAMLIAPATANTMAKMVTGACDNLLLAVFLSARCPVVIAPAMDLDMFVHPSTAANLTCLKERGVHVIAPETGELASGLSGKGRMAEPENIVEELSRWLASRAPLRGKRVMVTAGPTHEPIDPVRFIGNHSTGKMGFALAGECARLGAEVHLIAGPVHLDLPHPSIKRTNVRTAAEMHSACLKHANDSHIIVMAAAVADYRLAVQAETKIKKSHAPLSLDLEPTVDILSDLASRKQPGQLVVGFALETNNELEHARLKLERKNLDLVVLNSLRDEGAGFSHDTNKVTLLEKGNIISTFELKSKAEVASDIVQKIIDLCAPFA